MSINLDSKIIDVVNTKIISLHPKDSIKTATELFNRTNKNLLPVLVGHEFRGVLFKQNFSAVKKANTFLLRVQKTTVDISPMLVEDFYADEVKIMSIKSSIRDAMKFFTTYRQYYIPIIDESKFIGLVTPFDIFKHFLELPPLK